MSFSEATPAPLPAGQTTVGPSTSLPVQLGTERGTVPLPSVLLHLAVTVTLRDNLASPIAFCSLGQLPQTLVPLSPAFWNNPIDPLGLAFG